MDPFTMPESLLKDFTMPFHVERNGNIVDCSRGFFVETTILIRSSLLNLPIYRTGIGLFQILQSSVIMQLM